MSDWVAKRFWTDASVEQLEGGYAVHLDGRAVKTPAKAQLILPTRPLAEAMAAEWREVDEKIDPTVMPFTQTANSAIDKVATQFDDVATMLAAYGESDLLCYRAGHPEGLVQRQADGWDPMLDWAAATFDAKLQCTTGLMPIKQDANAIKRLTAPLFVASPFELAALHDLIAMSGSLVLALAVTQRRISAPEAWVLSRIDEIWQAEQWGSDEDAVQTAEIKRIAFLHAANVHKLAS